MGEKRQRKRPGGAKQPKQTRMPRAVREQQMLDAAVRTFGQRGYRAASMDEIAELAGVSKPLVYLYLNSKEELFSACIRREAAALVAAVREGAAGRGVENDRAVPGAPAGLGVPAVSGVPAGLGAPAVPGVPAVPADRQLWDGLRAFFTHTAERPDGWAVLHSQARTQGAFAAEVAAMREEIVSFVTTLIAEAARSAHGDPSLPEREVAGLAQALVGAAESLAGWANVEGSVSAKEAAATLMNFAWAGLGGLMEGRRWVPSPL